jgi:hypothetical protein
MDKGHAVLDVGAAHKMLVGSELAIYPFDACDFSDPSRCPKVRVTEVWPLESKAEAIGQLGADARIEPGCQAIPSKPLVVELRIKFWGCSIGTNGDKFAQLRTEINCAQQSLTRLASSVRVIPDSDGTADYCIAVENDHYKLLNNKNEFMSHFPSSTDPVLFLRNLGHLARFEMCRKLENPDVPQSLDGKFNFTLEVAGKTGKNSVPDFDLMLCIQLTHQCLN